MVEHIRDWWQEGDIVAPLEIQCPTCHSEMEIGFGGTGLTKSHPERKYFLGRCPDRHHYLYYHKVGWRNIKDLDINMEKLPKETIKDLQLQQETDPDKPDT